MNAPPFASVLVANRGEIACRIFRTARAMGMKTVAVHSDADAKAKHVREADVAVHIGPSPAADSYLRGEKILAAAKATGAAAIHPGYGFLSENPEFAEAVIAAGLIWIGPTPAAIRAMGLKDEAKRIAIAAGVPVLAGYQGEDQSEKRLLDEAKAIGFPVLIKAVAGGGGRGIREVSAGKDFGAQLASARREAKAAFGDDRVLVEKLVQRPRHIEVQVFGDRHGNLVHMYERDCSLQRRRQKVIEEAPAPGMTEEVRAAMTDAALKVARAVAYENAGTVEFIVDGEGPLRADGFWFLEMNTRLQVEHPVTEAVTGLDLVEWQFRVAAGEKLPRTQSEITLSGHAIEARICAEDPGEGFRPSVGRLEFFGTTAPAGALRFHAGFETGDTISPHYDSLMSKAVSRGTDRQDAARKLALALSGFGVAGPESNVGFLYRLVRAAMGGDVGPDTGYIADNLQNLIQPPPGLTQRAASAAAGSLQAEHEHAEDVWRRRDGWRLNGPARRNVAFDTRDGLVLAQPDASSSGVRLTQLGSRRFLAVVEGESILLEPPGSTADHAGLDAGDDIHAPLPGKIVALSARVGAQVKKGEALVTLEAMKMEHALKAPRDGVVAEVAVREGAQVGEGAVLVRLRPEEAG